MFSHSKEMQFGLSTELQHQSLLIIGNIMITAVRKIDKMMIIRRTIIISLITEIP